MRVASEGPIKITKATIDAAWRRRQRDHRLVIRDKECRGLALIVNPTTMTWSYAYRPRGTDPHTKKRWTNKTVTLGSPASLSPEDARIDANRLKGQAAAGSDPAADKKAKAEAEQKKRSTTLIRLVDGYARAMAKRPKMRGAGTPSPAYIDGELTQVRLALTEMEANDTPAADLGDPQIRELLNTGSTARKRFGALSRFLDWCHDAAYIPANPCTMIARSRRPRAAHARSNYLTPAQLATLWKTAEALREPVWRDIARFLIAVPCRRNEAARLDWSHLDLASAEWRQPDKMTKNRDPHRLHLHQLALKVLEARRQAAAKAQAGGDPAKLARVLAAGQPRSGLVFPAPLSGRAVDTFTAIKESLTEATKPKEGEEGVPLIGWTWHDFRRSFATALGEAGIPEAVADAVLNHRQSATRGGVLGVYQRASRWPEQAKAMALWGNLLADAIDGRTTQTAEIVQLPSRSAG